MARSTVESTVPVAFDFAEKASIHVLHVDDEVSLLKVSQSCLEMEGSLRVDVAASVEEALRRMEKKTFDAIISDYVMPGKDGLEFLKELRDNGSNIPFIIFTGKGREEVAIRALNLGADQYLSKAGAPETVYRELAHSITQAVKRRRAEEELRKSEERYRNLFELAPDGIVTLDTKGVVTSCNATVRKLTGYTKDEIIGKHFSRLGFLQAGDIPKYLKRFTSIVGGDLPKPFEAGWKGRDGSSSISEFHVSLVKTNGKTEGVQVVARDITERRKAEELYKNIVELSPESIITINKKGMITSCNVTATKMLGYSKEEMIGKHFSKIGVIRARDLPSFLKLFLSVLREEVNEPLELTFQTKTGTTLRAEVRVGLLRENGKVVGIQAISQDITQRKKVESEIRDSQEKFQKLFIHNPEASVYVNVDYEIVDVNPRFINLFGYHLDEIKGKYIDEVVVPEDRTEEGKMLCQKASKGYVYHDTLRKKKDGSLVPVSISAAPITVKGQLIGHVAMYKDITAQRKTESELEEARRHFQMLFNLMVDPVAIVDKKGKILEVTQKAEEVTGFKREELLGKNFLNTKIATTKSKAIMMKNLAKRMMGIPTVPYEVEILTKDGRKLPHEVNAAKIEYKGTPADLVVFRDISERRKMEEKLRVVGSLTRHDVQNKLSVITGNVYLARSKLSDNDETLEYLKDVESACQQVQKIFDFARNYERLGLEKLVYIDVGKALDESITLFSDSHNLEIVNECHPLRVLADSLLRQVFYNLIDNSLMHGERVSRIRVHYEDDGNQLRLIYEDDGVGIPSSEKEQIFREGHGRDTGYGLYLIRRICEVYGWTIRETGKHNKGAQFTMVVPKNDGKNELYKV